MVQGFGFKKKFNTRLRKEAVPTVQPDPLCTGTVTQGSDTNRPAKRAHTPTVVRKQDVLWVRH